MRCRTGRGQPAQKRDRWPACQRRTWRQRSRPGCAASATDRWHSGRRCLRVGAAPISLSQNPFRWLPISRRRDGVRESSTDCPPISDSAVRRHVGTRRGTSNTCVPLRPGRIQQLWSLRDSSTKSPSPGAESEATRQAMSRWSSRRPTEYALGGYSTPNRGGRVDDRDHHGTAGGIHRQPAEHRGPGG